MTTMMKATTCRPIDDARGAPAECRFDPDNKCVIACQSETFDARQCPRDDRRACQTACSQSGIKDASGPLVWPVLLKGSGYIGLQHVVLEHVSIDIVKVHLGGVKGTDERNMRRRVSTRHALDLSFTLQRHAYPKDAGKVAHEPNQRPMRQSRNGSTRRVCTI
jgi:hypothetical protein